MGDLLRGALTVPTKLGNFCVQFTPRGVTRVDFGGRRSAARGRAPAFAGKVAADLRSYAEGKPVRWRVPLDFSGATDFRRKVWRALLAIPRGQTRSYGWIAKKIGKPKAARAVGAACGANPIPIIVPCHRVVAGDGSLGGYSGGLHWKKRLLRLEGVKV